MKITASHVKEAIRALKSNLFRPIPYTDDFAAFAFSQVLPLLPLRGYKLDDKRALAVDLAFNLIRASLEGRTVGLAGDRNVNPEIVRQVVEAYERGGLMDTATGSEASGKRNRHLARPELMNLQKSWGRHLLRDAGPDSPLVILTTGKVDAHTGTDVDGEPANAICDIREAVIEKAWHIAGPDFDRVLGLALALMGELESYRDMLAQINDFNEQFEWLVTPPPMPDCLESWKAHPYRTQTHPTVKLRQIHSGALYRAMRLYTFGGPNGQNMTRATRTTMTIDGQPTVELDFKCLHLSMLYRLAGAPWPDGTADGNDLYLPRTIFPKFYAKKPDADLSGKVRDLVKVATNAALNASDFNAAVGAVIAHTKERQHQDARQIMFQFEGLKSSDVVERIANAHPRIKGSFFSGAGANLMTRDGRMMLHILWDLRMKRIPAFPLHDSLRIRACDRLAARRAMVRNYKRFIGGFPLLAAK